MLFTYRTPFAHGTYVTSSFRCLPLIRFDAAAMIFMIQLHVAGAADADAFRYAMARAYLMLMLSLFAMPLSAIAALLRLISEIIGTSYGYGTLRRINDDRDGYAMRAARYARYASY